MQGEKKEQRFLLNWRRKNAKNIFALDLDVTANTRLLKSLVSPTNESKESHNLGLDLFVHIYSSMPREYTSDQREYKQIIYSKRKCKKKTSLFHLPDECEYSRWWTRFSMVESVFCLWLDCSRLTVYLEAKDWGPTKRETRSFCSSETKVFETYRNSWVTLVRILDHVMHR